MKRLKTFRSRLKAKLRRESSSMNTSTKSHLPIETSSSLAPTDLLLQPSLPESSITKEPSVPEPSVPEPSVPEPSVPEPSVPETQPPEPSLPQPPVSKPSLPPLPPSSLWDRAFDRVNSKTKKWLQSLEFNSLDRVQPKEQIEQIVHLIEDKKLAGQNDKPLKIEIGNQTIIVREYIADAVNFLTMVGDAAIAFAPPQASAPWAVAKAIMKIPVKEVEQSTALVGVVKWFVRIVRRGQVYELLYNYETTGESATSNLNDALLDLYVASMELLATSEDLLGENIIKQTLSAILQPDHATGLVSDLFKKEQKLSLEVQSCESSRSAKSSGQVNKGIEDLKTQLGQLSFPLIRVDHRVANLLEKVNKAEREKLWDFISSEKFGKSHAAVADSRTLGTGEWLLNDEGFRAWQDIPSSSTLLWLRGTVGTGKTYLTSKVIDHVEETLKASQHDEGFAFFYCSRSGPSLQDPHIALKSFVRQLSCKAHDFTNVQKSLIQKRDSAKERGTDLSVKDCEDLILEFLNVYSKTTIVLDALDESDTTSHNLATILIDLMEKSRKPVKIFISSRPDREFMDVLATKTTIIVDGDKQQGDIEKFLEENLYTTTFFKGRTPNIQENIRETFSSKHKGIANMEHGNRFRWVYLRVQALKRCVTDEAIDKWARTLPQGLTQAYDQLWEEIKAHESYDVDLAERIIKWVLCAFKPLEVDALLEAIRYVPEGITVVRKEKQTRQQILSLCQDLLTIDEQRYYSSSSWKKRCFCVFPHASVAEYFEFKGWTISSCDLFVSRVCLGILTDVALRDALRDEFHQEKIKPNFDEDFSFYHHFMSQWPRYVERYEKWLGDTNNASPDADFVTVLKSFLGSPGESSPRYREWVNMTGKLINVWDILRGLIQSETALFTMCKWGFYYTLRDWWEGGKVDKGIAFKNTKDAGNPLELAAGANCMPIVEHLVRLMVNDPRAGTHFEEAFSYAVGTHKNDVVKFLVRETKADVNKTLSSSSMSAVVSATDNSELLQWFVEEGIAEVNKVFPCRYFCTALIKAVVHRNVQSVKILLKAGADVNAVMNSDNYGSALVATAAADGDGERDVEKKVEIIRLLIEYGADVNLPAILYGFRTSPLEAAICAGVGLKSQERAKLLLAAGADPMIITNGSVHGNALAAAAFWGYKDLLKDMIDKVGKERAVEALRQGECPDPEDFTDPEDFEDEVKKRASERRDIAAFLAREFGLSLGDLGRIGLGDAIPKDLIPEEVVILLTKRFELGKEILQLNKEILQLNKEILRRMGFEDSKALDSLQNLV